MNSDTIALIDRPYQEIVGDILTAIVGGVVREPIIYDANASHYPLANQADTQRNIRSITGSVTPPGALYPVHYTFQNGVDFTYSAGTNAVVWITTGKSQVPDDGSTFYVDYFLANSTSPLTDINIGSVTRTLSEAISREIATVYQQINLAYLSGFVDTATGQSLDLVVSILGVTRLTAEYATGLVTFFRDQAAGNGSITIPEQTVLTTSDGKASFVTTSLATLQQGQIRIDVPVSATGASVGQAGLVGANTINTLAQSILGIDHVINFDPTIQAASNETDDQLRARAKAVLRGLNKATVASLIQVVAEERAQLVEIWDPNSPAPQNAPPGQVILQVKAEPERFLSIQSAVQGTRAAGVLATVVAKYVFVTPRVAVTPPSGMTAAGKIRLIGNVINAIQGHVDSLGAGAALEGKNIIATVTAGNSSIAELANMPQRFKIMDVQVSRFDAGPPPTDTYASQVAAAVLQAISSTPTRDPTTLTALLTTAINNVQLLPPGGDRIPDRSLLLDVTGQRQATDAEIQAGQFQVSPNVKGEQWQIVLDMDSSDVSLLGS
jgi:hypothetical protein